jgi:tetratricopeptide (TPR) repeat protein
MAENPRIEELRRRVQADPASIVFAALAEEFRRVGRYDDAIETCRTGLQRHPAYLSARVTLGRALIETGDYEGAREELETVLRSAPENLTAIRGLAQIHERLGHSNEMDPHVADMLKTMHAESIRVAAQPPPEPPPPVREVYVPPPVSELEPEPQIELEPDVEPEPQLEPSIIEDRGSKDPDTILDPRSSILDHNIERPELDVTFDLSLAPPPAPPPEPDLALMTLVPEPGVVIEAPAGPDPEMLATLARLERFLGAIQSLRG